MLDVPRDDPHLPSFAPRQGAYRPLSASYATLTGRTANSEMAKTASPAATQDILK